eukprot:6581372-Alexandrium_andersonii.AAC.1
MVSDANRLTAHDTTGSINITDSCNGSTSVVRAPPTATLSGAIAPAATASYHTDMPQGTQHLRSTGIPTGPAQAPAHPAKRSEAREQARSTGVPRRGRGATLDHLALHRRTPARPAN